MVCIPLLSYQRLFSPRFDKFIHQYCSDNSSQERSDKSSKSIVQFLILVTKASIYLVLIVTHLLKESSFHSAFLLESSSWIVILVVLFASCSILLILLVYYYTKLDRGIQNWTWRKLGQEYNLKKQFDRSSTVVKASTESPYNSGESVSHNLSKADSFLLTWLLHIVTRMRIVPTVQCLNNSQLLRDLLQT